MNYSQGRLSQTGSSFKKGRAGSVPLQIGSSFKSVREEPVGVKLNNDIVRDVIDQQELLQ